MIEIDLCGNIPTFAGDRLLIAITDRLFADTGRLSNAITDRLFADTGRLLFAGTG